MTDHFVFSLLGTESLVGRDLGRNVGTSGPDRPRPAPITVCPGQDMAALGAGMAPCKSDTQEDFDRILPNDVTLCAFGQALFVMYPGLDGLVIDGDGVVMEEPSCFCRHELYQTAGGRRLSDMLVHSPIDDVFVRFDAAWTNYYHWVGYVLARALIASEVLPRKPILAMPDIMRGSDERHRAYDARIRVTASIRRVWRAGASSVGRALSRRATAWLPA